MNGSTYRAKKFYQDKKVVDQYEQIRFKNWYGRIAHQTETTALELVVIRYFDEPGKVLDVPCGTGRLFPVMLKQGMQVVGGDISPEMLKIARVRYADEPNVSFEVCDAEKMVFGDNTFDYLTSYRFMSHLPPDIRGRVLGEMVRVTRKILVINYHVATLSPLYVFNRLLRRWTCSPYPMTLPELRKELAAYRNIEVLEIRKLSWYERSSVLAVLRKRA